MAVAGEADLHGDVADFTTGILEQEQALAQAQLLAVIAQREAGRGVEDARQVRRRAVQLVGEVGERQVVQRPRRSLASLMICGGGAGTPGAALARAARVAPEVEPSRRRRGRSGWSRLLISSELSDAEASAAANSLRWANNTLAHRRERPREQMSSATGSPGSRSACSVLSRLGDTASQSHSSPSLPIASREYEPPTL
jgi:hypothetical protein